MVLDADGKLATIPADGIIVVGLARQMPAEGERLPGTSVVVLGEARMYLAAWLAGQDLATAAKLLGTSVSTVQRMRSALGISMRYAGSSRTTAWRRKKVIER